MLYVTGDTHGNWMSRLNSDVFPEQKEMTKKDYVLILGDFGLWMDTKEERYNLDWLDAKPFTTLFVSGNHENFDRLEKLSVEEWNSGKIQKVRSSIYHLTRGQIFNIEGHSFFTFGGASSHDIQDGVLEKDDPRIKEWDHDYTKMFRINHVSWWKQEMPSKEEMQEGLINLENTGNKVDYIVTHSPYTSVLSEMDGGAGLYQTDYLTEYLQNIKDSVEYKQWLFGHMHRNHNFQEDRSVCMYEQIVRLL